MNQAFTGPGGTFPLKEPGYECVRHIGSGGYGSVFLFSRAGKSDDYVAGKFVYRDAFGVSTPEESASAYKRAFEGLRKFRSLTDSPYLLRIFAVRPRHQKGYFCYMMELADDITSGRQIDPVSYRPRTLRNELEPFGKRQRLPIRRCIQIAVMLGRGLRILHLRGFAHRDVRTSNIIFVHDTPKLADIDLLTDDQASLASYIPKEYAAPEGAHSSRADLFSFGKTLYEMCTGLPVKCFPTLPSDIRYWPDHKEFLAVNKVIAKACAYDLRRRYESVDEMLADLQAI